MELVQQFIALRIRQVVVQNDDIRRLRLAEAQRLRARADAVHVVAVGQPRGQQGGQAGVVFDQQDARPASRGSPLENDAHRLDELRRADRHREEGIGAQFGAEASRFVSGIGRGSDQDWRLIQFGELRGADQSAEPPTIDARHIKVRHQQIGGRVLANHLQGLSRAAESMGLTPYLPQQPGK